MFISHSVMGTAESLCEEYYATLEHQRNHLGTYHASLQRYSERTTLALSSLLAHPPPKNLLLAISFANSLIVTLVMTKVWKSDLTQIFQITKDQLCSTLEMEYQIFRQQRRQIYYLQRKDMVSAQEYCCGEDTY